MADTLMCGRYGLRDDRNVTVRALEAEWRGADPGPRYNIAPTQHAPVVVHEGERRYLDMYRWGLVPFWAKDPSIGNRMINARSETVHEKPAFRTAYRKRRCLVPASGFYEWQKTERGKVPHWIHPAEGELLTFAGLWEEWRPKDAEPIRSYTILTTAANGFMQRLHDRMPVILAAPEREAWLDPDASDSVLRSLLRPGAEELLAAHPVSLRVNSPANDDVRLTEPELPTEAGGFERNPA